MDIANRKIVLLTALCYVLMFIPVSSLTIKTNYCTVPSQPANGYRQLHKSQCPSKLSNCDVQEGTKLPPYSHLIYTCNPEYQNNGSDYIFCDDKGNWSDNPVCTEVHCQSLASASTNADCKLNGKKVSCDSPASPGTIAHLSCREHYQETGSFKYKLEDEFICDITGQWNPTPVPCVPRCGVIPPEKEKKVKNPDWITCGYLPVISQLPWHASLYREETLNGPKEFVCGATIIKEKFLLTAAHCVYNETYRRIENPYKYYIATGNILRGYDDNRNNDTFTKTARVKNIFVHCNYLGPERNYANDIAILEIEEPFVLSSTLLPACFNNDEIESGLGVVAGFGITHLLAEPSYILQAASLPYVASSKCKSSKHYIKAENLLTADKFCAGYENGTAVCNGDSGGGLVFETGNVWYLRGIVSLSLGTAITDGRMICNSHSYSLYTRVSTHINWIEDIINRSETSQPIPPC